MINTLFNRFRKNKLLLIKYDFYKYNIIYFVLFFILNTLLTDMFILDLISNIEGTP